MQRLSDDGIGLIGERHTVLLNDRLWEGSLIEGPFLKKHGGYWYLFYSANSCCTRACNYSIGVARSRALEGPWEKNARNPIVQGNDEWRCPGHGSIVTDSRGRDVLMYHGMHARDWVYTGRQALVDRVEWGSDGWPSINEGRGPGNHAEGFLGAVPRRDENRFEQAFTGGELGPGWQWPVLREPGVRIEGGTLTLRAAAPEPVKPGKRADAPAEKKDRPDPERITGLVARSVTRGDYSVVATIDVARMNKSAEAGIAAYGRAENNLGAHYRDGRIIVFNRMASRETVLGAYPAPAGEKLYLRMSAREGRFFRFEASSDGKSWGALGGEINGYHLPPWDLGIRWALTVGGSPTAIARFNAVSIE